MITICETLMENGYINIESFHFEEIFVIRAPIYNWLAYNPRQNTVEIFLKLSKGRFLQYV